MQKSGCGELSSARHQAPTKATPSFPSAGQERQNTRKGFWVHVGTGRDLSAAAVTGKADLTQEKRIISCNTYKIRAG